MARNRRKVEGEVTFSWIATRMLLFVLLVGFLLGITFLKRRNLKMGDELRGLDRELEVALEKSQAIEGQLTRYLTPRELEAKNLHWGLGMTRPMESQIRRFREPEAYPRGIIRPRLYVQSDAAEARGANR